ncbi:hypothetical protein P7K49_034034, partial [Saguinus oedipus]
MKYSTEAIPVLSLPTRPWIWSFGAGLFESQTLMPVTRHTLHVSNVTKATILAAICTSV